MSPLEQYLVEDHARLIALLEASTADAERFDHESFEQFRAGLQRHMGIEEKLLIARLRKMGEPLPLVAILRVEHAALATLMVPVPDHALARQIEQLFLRHTAREEGAKGFYEECAALLGAEADMLLEHARAGTSPPPAADSGGRQ
jgi:hypothetical protein